MLDSAIKWGKRLLLPLSAVVFIVIFLIVALHGPFGVTHSGADRLDVVTPPPSPVSH